MALVINFSVTRSLYCASACTQVIDIVPVILQDQINAWSTQNEKKPM